MYSMLYQLIVCMVSVLIVLGLTSAISCPCSDKKLCEPIRRLGGKEVFIFSVSDDTSHWEKYDWTKITTIGTTVQKNPKLMCIAHQHNAKIVQLVSYPKSQMTNKTARAIWTKQQVQNVVDNFIDGVNIDYEDSIYRSEVDIRKGYTDLVNETNIALKVISPYYQVSVDVVWFGGCQGNYCYDYKGLADASDFLFIMDYDEGSELIAYANSPYEGTKYGLKKYLSSGIKSSSLVMGLPWYGYRYPCRVLKGKVCIIKDKGGRQLDYPYFMSMLNQSTSGRLWDPVALSPFFNYVNVSDKQAYQMWYDDPHSLTLKYPLQAEFDLRGVGIWHADAVNYDDSPESIKQRTEMWNALPRL